MELESFAHGKGLLSIHLVLVPKYRLHAFARPEIRQHLERVLRQVAQEHGYRIQAMEVMPDHVHLFLDLPPIESPSRAFQYLKGRSSYELFRAFPILRDMYPRGHLWTPGKFCRSVGAVTDKTVRMYILNQTKDPSKYPYSFLRAPGGDRQQRTLWAY